MMSEPDQIIWDELAPFDMDRIHDLLRQVHLRERAQLLDYRGIKARVLAGAAQRPVRCRLNPGKGVDAHEYLQAVEGALIRRGKLGLEEEGK